MKTLLFKESIEIIIVLIVFMVIFKNNHYVFTGCLCSMILFSWFYRLPKRHKPDYDDTMITSPCDGEIYKISKTIDNMYKISIYMSIFDVHVQWYPVDGVIRNILYKKGEFNLAHILEKSEFNEKMSTIIQNKYGVVRVDQIAGQLARRIVNWSISNTYVKKGNLMGMIKLSSRVDIFIPSKKTKLFVEEGDIVKGKTTAIAKWI